MILPYKDKKPQVDPSVFVAPGTKIIGDVKIGKDSSIWFNAVLRGDEAPIIIGERCSIQQFHVPLIRKPSPCHRR